MESKLEGLDLEHLAGLAGLAGLVRGIVTISLLKFFHHEPTYKISLLIPTYSETPGFQLFHYFSVVQFKGTSAARDVRGERCPRRETSAARDVRGEKV